MLFFHLMHSHLDREAGNVADPGCLSRIKNVPDSGSGCASKIPSNLNQKIVSKLQ
jgi:hypothetical protein